jgi:hypothetical protein
MSQLPKGLELAFSVAMGELGFCSTAWLFVREVALYGGQDLVRSLRDELGRTYAVIDAVAADWLAGHRAPVIAIDPFISASQGLKKLLVVGVEADFLDAIVPLLPNTEIGLLRHSLIDLDWDRVAANYQQHVQLVDMTSIAEWAGNRSGLLTFLYGHNAHVAHVRSAWLRIFGQDIQTQFRSIIGWNVLRTPLFMYPRWFVETSVQDFSEVL